MLILPGAVASAGVYVPPVGLASPFAVADFKDEAYTINGSPVTLADMIVQNTDWSSFDPSVIVNGTGLVGDGTNWPVLNSSFAAGMLASGVTIKATVQLSGANGKLVLEMLDLPGYNNEVFASLTVGAGVFNARITDGATTLTSDNPPWIGKNVVAVNLSAADLSISPNGYAGIGFDPVEGAPTHIAIALDSGFTIEKLEFFALQDRANLYAYSFHGAPHNSAAPVVSGSPQVGETLSCSTGGWDNSPTSFEYVWQTENGVMGTDPTVVVAADQVDFNYFCSVTGVNLEGRETANSNTVGPVTA